MNQIELNKIYNAIINNGPIITESTFLKSGISDAKEAIHLLVQEGTLKEIKPEQYQVYKVEQLYNYGLTLFKSNCQLRANLCFEKCYQMDSTHRNAALQVFFLAVKSKEYPRAYRILESIMQGAKEEKERCDNNLYLYLLNILAKCPHNYEEQVKSLMTKDVIPKTGVTEK